MKAAGKLDKLVTDIEVCGGFDPKTPPDPIPARMTTNALWDTGASRSVLTSDLVRKLGLVPSGLTEVHHGGGSSKSNTYIVNFYLPNGVGMIGIVATEFEASHADFGALIGMDVIGVGDFAVTNVGGQTWMSFRTPSYASIDYVVEADRHTFGNMGRNEPCFCGSGQKFKKCHGANL